MSMQAAYKYHIMGFVQNMKDRTVYIEAEGEEPNLKKFIEWCRSGALGAKIEEIVVNETQVKNFTSFDIKRN
jgi:acylphosphatase